MPPRHAYTDLLLVWAAEYDILCYIGRFNLAFETIITAFYFDVTVTCIVQLNKTIIKGRYFIFTGENILDACCRDLHAIRQMTNAGLSSRSEMRESACLTFGRFAGHS